MDVRYNPETAALIRRPSLDDRLETLQRGRSRHLFRRRTNAIHDRHSHARLLHDFPRHEAGASSGLAAWLLFDGHHYQRLLVKRRSRVLRRRTWQATLDKPRVCTMGSWGLLY